DQSVRLPGVLAVDLEAFAAVVGHECRWTAATQRLLEFGLQQRPSGLIANQHDNSSPRLSCSRPCTRTWNVQTRLTFCHVSPSYGKRIIGSEQVPLRHGSA